MLSIVLNVNQQERMSEEKLVSMQVPKHLSQSHLESTLKYYNITIMLRTTIIGIAL